MISIAVIVVLSYLVGSIPGSVWIGKRIYGIDVRQHGMGNPGGTNVFRVLGWKAGVLCSVVDMGKGLVAAGLIAMIRIDALPTIIDVWQMDTVVRLIAGLAAVAGHMFPIWAGFHGGKGVNTSAGVLTPLRSEEHTSELQSRGHLVCRHHLAKTKQHDVRPRTD